MKLHRTQSTGQLLRTHFAGQNLPDDVLRTRQSKVTGQLVPSDLFLRTMSVILRTKSVILGLPSLPEHVALLGFPQLTFTPPDMFGSHRLHDTVNSESLGLALGVRIVGGVGLSTSCSGPLRGVPSQVPHPRPLLMPLILSSRTVTGRVSLPPLEGGSTDVIRRRLRRLRALVLAMVGETTVTVTLVIRATHVIDVSGVDEVGVSPTAVADPGPAPLLFVGRGGSVIVASSTPLISLH